MHPTRDRSFISQQSRAPSRSSNSTASTRATSHSTTNSSFTTSSPKLSSATLASQRPGLSTGQRKPPPSHLSSQLMREAGYDARQSPVSSYLQEKLLKERKVELDNKSISSGRMSNDPRNTLEYRAVQSSPIRKDVSDTHRPQSSGGADPTTKKKGMGLKEIEQVCGARSTLLTVGNQVILTKGDNRRYLLFTSRTSTSSWSSTTDVSARRHSRTESKRSWRKSRRWRR